MKSHISTYRIGICISLLCFIHCFSIPIFLILGFDSLLKFIDQEWLEWIVIAFALIIGLVSFISGFRIHRKHYVPVLFVAGFFLLVNNESVANTWLSVGLSLAGTLLVTYAHVQNLKWKHSEVVF
ncbi:MAG: MerC domain-containing protein [Bacteroidota bacterium]